MLRRSVYLSPRDPPVQLFRSVPKQLLDLDEQAHEGLHSVPATEPERRPQSALLCRRSKSRVNHGRMSKIPPVSRLQASSRNARRSRPRSSSPSSGHTRSMMWVSSPTSFRPPQKSTTDRGDGLFPEPSVNSKHGDLTNHILHSDEI